ncbi:hypothetical protein [Legionella waltersii]|uniref:hypothetical protein n=2 Tax=Legionella TaxID=445 RepID=UPI0018D5408D|nr:hypothetical protein [Legionella waltersii]
MQKIRELLESWQISIYFGTVIVAIMISMLLSCTTILEGAVNPALALMLFVTFLQVPIAD